MICPKCNSQINDNASFCPVCGTNMSKGDVLRPSTETPTQETKKNSVETLFPNAFEEKKEKRPHISPTKLEGIHDAQNKQAALDNKQNNSSFNNTPPPAREYTPAPTVQNNDDVSSIGLNFLSLFFPLIGAILFCILSKKTPNRGRDCGRAAMLGLVLSFVFSIIVSVLLVVAQISAIAGLAGGIIGGAEGGIESSTSSFGDDFSLTIN